MQVDQETLLRVAELLEEAASLLRQSPVTLSVRVQNEAPTETDRRKRPHPPEDHLTSAEAAEHLGLSAATLVDWRCCQRKGQPPYRKIGRYIWYRKSVLEKWIESQTRGRAA